MILHRLAPGQAVTYEDTKMGAHRETNSNIGKRDPSGKERGKKLRLKIFIQQGFQGFKLGTYLTIITAGAVALLFCNEP